MSNRKKNLIKADGKITNQHGVSFTADEKKHMVNLVNSANRKARRMQAEEMNMQKKVGGREIGVSVADYNKRMRKESDYALKVKSKSMQRFETRKDFDSYVKYLEKAVKRDYIPNKLKAHRENYMTAIKTKLGETADTQAIMKKIEGMSIKDYKKFLAENDEAEIGFAYGASAQKAKITQLKKSLKIS